MTKTKNSSCICMHRWSMIALAGLMFVVGICYGYYLSPKPPTVSVVPTAEESINSLVSFVNNAANLVTAKGEASFSEFRKSGDPWWMGDKYIFVYDMQGNTLVLPPSPDVEGTNRWNTQDAEGIYFVRNMAQQLQNQDTTWVMYSYPRPNDVGSTPKLAFVKKVKMGNKFVFVGSGLYY